MGIVYTYNDAGQPLTMTDATGVTTYTYDERGRLLTKTNPLGTLTYTYDASNNLSSVQSSNANGVSLSYGYDALNRLQTVADYGSQEPPLTHTYTYDEVGNLDTLTYANGVTHDWGYNSLNRLTTLAIANSTASLNSYTYTLSDAGYRTKQTETSGRVVDYTYDALYRLTSETVTSDPYAVDGTSSWTYDLVGNRLTQDSTLPDIAMQSETYSLNDWLDSHAYDDNGNTTESDGNVDIYDWRNRLIQRTTAGGDVILVAYDGNGDRFSKTVNGFTTYYHVDRNNLTGYAQVVEELNATLEVQVVYAYGLDLISQDRFDGTDWNLTYYLYDGLGSVRGLANASGLVTDAYFYDAWGNLINTAGAGTANSYLFTGEQWDADLGMYFLRARYLNPETGRFHTLDTYEGRNGEPATLHKYLYAHANPVMGIDPTGNFTLNQVLMTTAVVGILANLAITSVGLDNISEAGWTNPSQIFAGANVRGSASTGRGIGISGSFGISFIYDLASGDIYGALNAKSSLNIFSSLKKGVKFKGFEGYAGFIWNNEPKTGAGVSGFTGFTAFMSVGTMRVALIAFKSVINPQIRASLLDISRKLAKSPMKNARIALSVGSEKKTALSVSVFSSSASNSPIGVGTLSFIGAEKLTGEGGFITERFRAQVEASGTDFESFVSGLQGGM